MGGLTFSLCQEAVWLRRTFLHSREGTRKDNFARGEKSISIIIIARLYKPHWALVRRSSSCTEAWRARIKIKVQQ